MKGGCTSFPWGDLLSWYEQNGRHTLPWRAYNHDEKTLSYRVWLSEIFLQQTQVPRVVGYFERVMERYPSIQSLAATDYDTFFPYYQGLGYYSRARNMLKTASIVESEYRGVFPREMEKLKILPGVGEYTARAILAFGYGEPYLAWDTNLEKVFSRYYHGSRLEKLAEHEKDEIEKDFRDFCISHCEADPAPNSEYVEESGEENPEVPSFGTEGRIQDVNTLDPSFHSGGRNRDTVRAINNALMDFAATVDLKNPANIDWEAYPIKSGKFYDTKGRGEPTEVKKSVSFPVPDATVVVVLHRDHKVYYAPVISSEDDSRSRDSQYTPCGGILLDKKQDISIVGYHPFTLAPSLTRDTRAYVQSYFRERYGLELSVRPVHKKWFSEDGKPYVMVNAQIQAGKHRFREYTKKEVQDKIR